MLRFLRNYSKGTKRITISYDERNDLLAKFPQNERYPVLSARAPVSRIKNIVDEFQYLDHTEKPLTDEFEIRGRVNSVRMAGKNLAFIDLLEGDKRLQVVVNQRKLDTPLPEGDKLMLELLRKGDSVSAVGRPWRTKAGELSLLSSQAVKMLSPQLKPLPDHSTGRTILKHNRVAELKAFKEARDILRVRASIIKHLQNFLIEKHEFLQVQTPHLSQQQGGASAKTFDTTMSDGTPLHLRVAPELWLKRLIISGFDRVFEVGNSYRNEAVDATHNPEFMTCEFYMAYADLSVLIDLTKSLLIYIAEKISSEFPQYADQCQILLNKEGWKQIDFVDEIEKRSGRTLSLDPLHLREMCLAADISVLPEDDTAKLLDRLAAHYIEPQCTGPTFITNHPSVMAPLAKEIFGAGSNNEIVISRRFELFIAGMEYVNAYEEENDPVAQLEKLKLQNPLVPDRNFVESLEWGLPPTGGWGMGIDRLVMLLTNSSRICDVLAFGDMNQTNRL